MIVFWLFIAVLTMGATAAVIVPLIRARGAMAPADERGQRLAVYRDRKREIEAERDAGRLNETEAGRAIDELARDAAALLGTGAPGSAGASGTAASGAVASGAAAGTAPAARRSIILAALLAIAIPVAALLIYRQIGAPDIVSLDPEVARGRASPAQLDAAIGELIERTRRQPDDLEAWANLAEGQRIKGNLPAAIAAFEQAIKRAPDDAQGRTFKARMLAEHAETLAASNNGDFNGRPVQMLEQALAIDPRNQKAIALMGAAQYRLGRPDRALVYLRTLLVSLPPGSEQARQMEGVVQRIEGEIAGRATGPAGPGAGLAAAPAAGAGGTPPRSKAPGTATAAAPATPGATITGTVKLADSLRAHFAGQATLFVVARAPDGPRVPYAVFRAQVDRLPVAFSLSDAQAMDPQRTLSRADSVVVEARLSRSGNATRQSGDLFGTSATIKPGAAGLTIEIDKVVP